MTILLIKRSRRSASYNVYVMGDTECTYVRFGNKDDFKKMQNAEVIDNFKYEIPKEEMVRKLLIRGAKIFN